MSTRTADELREALMRGSQEPMRFVFEETYRYCTRTMVKKSGCSAEDAEDVYMDALLIFRENLVSGKLKELTNLKTYVFGICWNLWRDLLRARERWTREENEVERQMWLLSAAGDQPLEPTEADLVRVQIRRVTQALNQLGDTCRQLLTLVYAEERSHREVAHILGLASAEVVKVTRHRCYQQWIRLVNKQEPTPHE